MRSDEAQVCRFSSKGPDQLSDADLMCDKMFGMW